PPLGSSAIQPAAYEERPPGEVRPIEPPERYANWDEFRMLSPAVQKVWLDLATKPLPDLREARLLSLPTDFPAEANEFSEPIASLTTQGDVRAVVHLISVFMVGFGF